MNRRRVVRRRPVVRVNREENDANDDLVAAGQGPVRPVRDDPVGQQNGPLPGPPAPAEQLPGAQQVQGRRPVVRAPQRRQPVVVRRVADPDSESGSSSDEEHDPRPPAQQVNDVNARIVGHAGHAGHAGHGVGRPPIAALNRADFFHIGHPGPLPGHAPGHAAGHAHGHDPVPPPPPPLDDAQVDAVAKAVLEVTPFVDPNWLRGHIQRTRILVVEELVQNILDGDTPFREALVDDGRLMDVSDEIDPTLLPRIRRPATGPRTVVATEVEALFEEFKERSTDPNFLNPPNFDFPHTEFFGRLFNTVRKDMVRAACFFGNHLDSLLFLSIIHKGQRAGYDMLIDFIDGNKDELARRDVRHRIGDYYVKELLTNLRKGPLATQRGNKRARPMDDCPPALRPLIEEVQEIASRASGVKKFECSVCFEEHAEKYAVVCEMMGGDEKNKEYDTAHQFCIDCVSGYAEASLTEMNVVPGGTGLKCMDPSCGRVVMYAAVVRTLDVRVRKLFDRRIQEEVLRAAGIESENCKYCSFAMEMDAPAEVDKVFNCVKCKASFCRLCQRDWTAHLGLRCEEMENKNETDDEKLRKKLEEQLARVAVRYCTACDIPFDKKEGCNKMTCRCGRFQCYLCRVAIKGYDHFCNHVAHHAQVCPQNCGKCVLFANGETKDAADRKKIVEGYRGMLPDDYLDKML